MAKSTRLPSSPSQSVSVTSGPTLPPLARNATEELQATDPVFATTSQQRSPKSPATMTTIPQSSPFLSHLKPPSGGRYQTCFRVKHDGYRRCITQNSRQALHGFLHQLHVADPSFHLVAIPSFYREWASHLFPSRRPPTQAKLLPHLKVHSKTNLQWGRVLRYLAGHPRQKTFATFLWNTHCPQMSCCRYSRSALAITSLFTFPHCNIPILSHTMPCKVSSTAPC